MKILILGATGMLGSMLMRFLTQETEHEVYGTARSPTAAARLPENLKYRIIHGIDATKIDDLAAALEKARPEIVINCIGVIKQLPEAKDPLVTIPINAILPHRLARFCSLINARLIHFSTDCVFAGTKGSYTEDDLSDASDLYGTSKFLGEVKGPNSLTLRTSIIGHELQSAHALIDWFLSQDGPVKGYRQAIYTGLPTVEVATVIKDYVLPNPKLSGLYQIASAKISKYDLLQLVAKQYNKTISINPDDTVAIDRSLDGSRFSAATGYSAPPWPDLIAKMHTYR